MDEYNVFDRITDMLATVGTLYLIGEIWREVELWLYGTSQESAVDMVVAILVTTFIVMILRILSLKEREEG